MTFRIDATLYPDVEPPDRLEALPDRIDFVARLCAAWDFGRLPDGDTVAALRDPTWREAVDATRLLTSPVYHLLRRWHALPCLPFLGSLPAQLLEDASLNFV